MKYLGTPNLILRHPELSFGAVPRKPPVEVISAALVPISPGCLFFENGVRLHDPFPQSLASPAPQGASRLLGSRAPQTRPIQVCNPYIQFSKTSTHVLCGYGFVRSGAPKGVLDSSLTRESPHVAEDDSLPGGRSKSLGIGSEEHACGVFFRTRSIDPTF